MPSKGPLSTNPLLSAGKNFATLLSLPQIAPKSLQECENFFLFPQNALHFLKETHIRHFIAPNPGEG
jgi:hypothetical protein